MDIKRIPINPTDITDKDWGRLLKYFHKEHQRLRPNDPLEPDEVIIKRMKHQLSDEQINFYGEFFVDTTTDEMVGLYIYATLTEKHPVYPKNPHLASVDINVLPEYRRRGIAHNVIKDLVPKLDEDGVKILICNSQESVGADFIKRLGGAVAQVNIENRVYIKDIDMDMIDRWIDEGKKRSPETKLEFYHQIPDNIAEQFCSSFERTMNQVPRDNVEINDMRFSVEDLRKREADFKKMEMVSITAVTIEPDGTISSLSEITYSPSNPKKVSQQLTGTIEEYRGRGLGKWVKAAMIRKIVDEFPDVEFISTSNATTNAPMLAINEKIGFKKYKENYVLQITPEQLKKYLETHS